jgi:hypothetical protein
MLGGSAYLYDGEKFLGAITANSEAFDKNASDEEFTNLFYLRISHIGRASKNF